MVGAPQRKASLCRRHHPWRDITHRRCFLLRIERETPILLLCSRNCLSSIVIRSNKVSLSVEHYVALLSMPFCMPSQRRRTQAQAPLPRSCMLRTTCLARGSGRFSAPTGQSRKKSNLPEERSRQKVGGQKNHTTVSTHSLGLTRGRAIYCKAI